MSSQRLHLVYHGDEPPMITGGALVDLLDVLNSSYTHAMDEQLNAYRIEWDGINDVTHPVNILMRHIWGTQKPSNSRLVSLMRMTPGYRLTSVKVSRMEFSQ